MPMPPRDKWFFAGARSSFPNIVEPSTLSQRQACPDAKSLPGCKVFQVPREDNSKAIQIDLDEVEAPESGALQDQVLVFQYKGKFHAVDNKCPHSSFPLSKGIPFDVEDFGIVLSSGITCPKHDWSFDLFSGRSDRGAYRLKLWETEVRAPLKTEDGTAEESIWVRKKQRIG